MVWALVWLCTLLRIVRCAEIIFVLGSLIRLIERAIADFVRGSDAILV